MDMVDRARVLRLKHKLLHLALRQAASRDQGLSCVLKMSGAVMESYLTYPEFQERKICQICTGPGHHVPAETTEDTGQQCAKIPYLGVENETDAPAGCERFPYREIPPLRISPIWSHVR